MSFVKVTLDELGTSYALVISVILANRLMIRVRTTYYESETTIVMPSIAFNDFSHTEPASTLKDELDKVELDRFDDAHGF